MKKSQHSRSFWSGRGFYLALALVIAGAATASFLAINNMMSELGKTPAPDSFEGGIVPWPDAESSPAEEKQEGVPVTPRPAASSSGEAASSDAPSSGSKPSGASSSSASRQTSVSAPPAPGDAPAAPAEPPAPPAPQYVSPHGGSVLQAFSGDELVYNETMRDWRTHNGLDIAADEGDRIKAPLAGEVTRAETDAQWGGVVEITEGPFTVRVCGLAKPAVKKGQRVAAGDTLGKLGELPAESALNSHVHVEWLEDGKYTDPARFFS